MIISKTKLLKVANQAKGLVPQRSKPGVARIIKFVRAQKNKRISSWKIAAKLAKTGLCKSSVEIKQFYDILDVIKPCSYIDVLEKNKALRMAKATPRRNFRQRRIPSSHDFINTCKKLKI